MKHNHKKRYPMSAREKRCAELAMMLARREPSNVFCKILNLFSRHYGTMRKYRNVMQDDGINPYKRKGEAI